ncbi:MAG: OmpA family protein [Steroidobacteraceae bacterium]|jgi:chemotaxis protein MotB
MSMRTAISGMNAAQTDLSATANNIANSSTLLLAFFVVMYSISSVNSGKYRVLSDALNAAFRGEPQREVPFTAELRQEGIPTPNVVAVPNPTSPQGTAAGQQTQLQPRAPSLVQIADNIAVEMQDLVFADQLMIRQHRGWVEIELRNDILFASGSASLPPAAQEIIRRLASQLVDVSNPILIEGHTDNLPIKTASYPSNWELSASRAASVARLMATVGIPETRLTVIGFGEHRPVETNENVEGRAANRRVILAILQSDKGSTDFYSQ